MFRLFTILTELRIKFLQKKLNPTNAFGSSGATRENEYQKSVN